MATTPAGALPTEIGRFAFSSPESAACRHASAHHRRRMAAHCSASPLNWFTTKPQKPPDGLQRRGGQERALIGAKTARQPGQNTAARWGARWLAGGSRASLRRSGVAAGTALITVVEEMDCVMDPARMIEFQRLGELAHTKWISERYGCAARYSETVRGWVIVRSVVRRWNTDKMSKMRQEEACGSILSKPVICYKLFWHHSYVHITKINSLILAISEIR